MKVLGIPIMKVLGTNLLSVYIWKYWVRIYYRYIYESTGYEFKDIEKILVRNNCVFKGYAKNERDKIVSEKNKLDEEKKVNLFMI